MTSSREVWLSADSAVQDRARGTGFRLAIAYHDGDVAGIASLMPEGEYQLKLVMGALSFSLYALNQFDPPGTPEEVWVRVSPLIDSTTPREVRPRVRALLALIAHSMRNAEMDVAYEAEEADPSASVHLYSAILAMRVAEGPGSIELIRTNADKLDPRT